MTSHTIEKVHHVKRTLRGTVVSDKMKDTVVVEVHRFVKHPKYKKYFTKTTRVKVHNPGNTKHLGEIVTIEECRPMSKEKHFRVLTNERSE